jgi:hypothetical protein
MRSPKSKKMKVTTPTIAEMNSLFVGKLREMMEAGATDRQIAAFARTPFVNSKVPDFNAEAVYPNKEIGRLSLSDYEGKWVCLFFYPLDFTFVCPTEICAFGDRADEFASLNCQVYM